MFTLGKPDLPFVSCPHSCHLGGVLTGGSAHRWQRSVKTAFLRAAIVSVDRRRGINEAFLWLSFTPSGISSALLTPGSHRIAPPAPSLPELGVSTGLGGDEEQTQRPEAARALSLPFSESHAGCSLGLPVSLTAERGGTCTHRKVILPAAHVLREQQRNPFHRSPQEKVRLLLPFLSAWPLSGVGPAYEEPGELHVCYSFV